MKKQTMFNLASMPKMILAVVLIVCIGAVMGLMGWVLTKQTRVEAPNKTTEKVVNWQTYKNEEFGFEVEYPEDWKINLVGDSIDIATVEKNEYLKGVGTPPKGNAWITFNFSISENYQEFEKREDNYGDPNNDEFVIIATRKIIIDNTHEIGVTTGYWKGDLFTTQYEQIFNQILSTLKFTEKDETADWETYRNEKFGFEVKYPENWYAYDSDPNNIRLQPEKDQQGSAPGPASQAFQVLILKEVDIETLIAEDFQGISHEQSEVFIDNIKGIKVKQTEEAIDLTPYIYLSKNNRVYKIKRNLGEIDTFNQILSTFKFIEKDEGLSWLPSDSSYFSSLISPDGQKVVWTENKFQENKMNSKLILADLDGQNKKVLIEKDLAGEKYFDPIRWSNSSEDVYFSEQHGGLGGYIIFSGLNNLSKINIHTGKLESLFDKSSFVGYIGDISPNEELIAHFPRIDGNPKLAIKNMKTGKENMFDIPIGEGFKGGGNSHFSPDNKYLVYNIAHWNPDDEYYRTIVVDSEGKNQRVIIDDSQKIYAARGWISNNEILLRGPDSIEYIIDIDGTNLRKK